MFSPAINYSKTPLRQAILDRTSLELGRTLNCVFHHLTRQFQQELGAYAPADVNECTEVIDKWIGRLNMIRSALANFPTLPSHHHMSTSRQSATISDSNSSTTHPRVRTPVQDTTYSQVFKADCLARDQYQCMITGRKRSEGFHTEVAHIIPVALASSLDCRNLDFWQMLEMFYGLQSTNTLFTRLHNTINSLQNLISLDHSIHSRFITGSLILTPKTREDYPMHPLNHHTGDYWLSVDYRSKSGKPELIESTKVLNTGEVRTLLPRSTIHIEYHEPIPGLISRFPLPSYFALRASLLSLKEMCEYTAPSPLLEVPGSSAATLTPSPAISIDTSDGLSTDIAASHYPGADQVLAASAILQQLVDSGVLGMSP